MSRSGDGPDAGRRLSPCPDTPNCVSSDATGAAAIEPLRLATAPDAAWLAVQHVLREWPRVRVVESSERYLHAEFTIWPFGFVDDVELELRPEEEIVAVRSASRVGQWDLGVNRRRVERLRKKLRKRGVVR